MAKKPMHKHSTILDIADKVGLSHMTVSRVLSGKAGVREATRQRVLKAAEKLNYSPNSLANGFRSGKTQSAGIVWQFVDPWAGDTAVGLWVMQALQRHGLATYQSQFSPDVTEMTAVLDDLLRRRVDAIVVGGTPEILSDPDVLRRLAKIPAVVAVSYAAIEGFKGDQIIHDRNAAIRQVVRHLVATGKKRPAMLMSMEVESNHDKLRAFKAALAEYGIPPHPRVLIEMGTTPLTLSQPFHSDTARYVEALHQTWPVGTAIDVDAIFSFNDLGAMVAANFLRERGVQVGEEVAVIGFNDDPASSLWQPPLASGDRSRAALAEATQDMVLSRLANPDLPPRQKTIEMVFLWRESAGGRAEGIASQ
jgi:LacI family transcriptional regulator